MNSIQNRSDFKYNEWDDAYDYQGDATSPLWNTVSIQYKDEENMWLLTMKHIYGDLTERFDTDVQALEYFDREFNNFEGMTQEEIAQKLSVGPVQEFCNKWNARDHFWRKYNENPQRS